MGKLTKRKTRGMVICCLAVVLIVLSACNKQPTPQEEMQELTQRIENGLGDDWQKRTETEVFDLIYSNDEGDTIVYYVCQTTYYDADPDDVTGLNTEAICAVIDPETAEDSRECLVSGLPGMIYQKDGRAYLCWTITPEVSCILEYDPETENEESMFRMAESVPMNEEQTEQ